MFVFQSNLSISFPPHSLPDSRRAHRRVPQPFKGLRVYMSKTPPCRSRQGGLSLRRSAVPRSRVFQKRAQKRYPTQRPPALSPLSYRLRRLRSGDEGRRAWGKPSRTSPCISVVLMPALLSPITGSAQPRPFAAHRAVANIFAQILPPTPTCVPLPSCPASTPRTAVAGQAPAARFKTHTPRTAHTQRSRASSASPIRAPQRSRRRTCAYAPALTPPRACSP